MSEAMVLDIKNLQSHFFTAKGEVPAVDGVSIQVPPGKIIGIVGESGCGKSMTAMSVMGLLRYPGRVVGGSITLEGRDITHLSPRELSQVRGNEISMIFQEPMTSLNPVYPVGKQVREAILLHQKVSKAEAKARVLDIFRSVGIPEPEKRYYSYPHQLSGGLRQRVMIGMAMVCRPKVMIADEPTTALDVTIEAQILRLMKKLCEEQGTSIILITHNMGVVAEVCDYVYVMYAGKVMEQAETFALFERPSHPYTQGLLKSIPKLDEKAERLYTIEGVVPNLLHLPKGCSFCTRCDQAQERCYVEKPGLYEAVRLNEPEVGGRESVELNEPAAGVRESVGLNEMATGSRKRAGLDESAAGSQESADMQGMAGGGSRKPGECGHAGDGEDSQGRAGQEKEGQEPGSQGREVREKAETHTRRDSGQEPASHGVRCFRYESGGQWDE